MGLEVNKRPALTGRMAGINGPAWAVAGLAEVCLKGGALQRAVHMLGEATFPHTSAISSGRGNSALAASGREGQFPAPPGSNTRG